MKSKGWIFERKVGAGRHLAVLGGAIAIATLSFALLFAVCAWLPYPLFVLWLHMGRTAKIMATCVYFFSLFCTMIWFFMVTTHRPLRLRAHR
jgi:hypothetical protein